MIKKKSVGIVTLGNSTNYGGVLQATALYKTLKKLNYEPLMITCQKMPSPWSSPIEYVKIRVRLYGSDGIYSKLRICGGVVKTLLSNAHYVKRKKKIDTFKTFIKRNLKSTKYYSASEDIIKSCPPMDIYVVGSDQVWNFEFTFGEFDERFLLKFTPENSKKYAYAASTGGKKSEEYIKKLLSEIRDFSAVSVREESLEEQMKSQGGDAKTLLDPTFLMSSDEWIKLEKKPKAKLPKDYILVYYLERSSKNDSIIERVYNNLGLPVVDIGSDYGKAKYKRIIVDTIGPAEFLYLAHHATYVITNSFHMTVFSILFEKKFLTVSRVNQESRMEDLLHKLNMSEWLLKNEKDWSIILKEYVSPISMLDQQKKESINFLKKMRE